MNGIVEILEGAGHTVVRLEKYNPMARPVGNFKKTVIACNEDDPNAYFMVTSEEGKKLIKKSFDVKEINYV